MLVNRKADWDFRTGWRWLLPLAGDSGIHLHGVPNEEEQTWRAALPALKWTRDSGESEVILVDGLQCQRQAMPSQSALQAARIVCVVAIRAQAKHWRAVLQDSFATIHEYGLLPSGNPRVAVPLSSSRHVITALSLHRPGRWIARLGLLLARMLAAIGNFDLLRGRVLLIATRSLEFIPHGAVQAELPQRLGQQAKDYALYLGTPDDNRKTIVLPLGDTAPSTILKVAETPTARASLSNEASALSALARSSLAPFVPRIEALVSTDAALVLHQEYRPRRKLGRGKLAAAVVAFLGQLASLGRESRSLSGLLASLPDCSSASLPGYVEVACRALQRRLRHLGESGTEVWVHRTHGDFAPWNCAWSDQGLFVFDWEESREQGLALGDAFYYVIAPAVLVQRNMRPAKTLEAALRLADLVVEASGARLDSRIYLALWLLGRVGQADVYGELAVMLERSWQ